ncbi:MAG: hypothetical protein IPL65_13180 [Lewinellaceae bacterium]|nr:hypothetical protein [Lewinellaceae bacterium]
MQFLTKVLAAVQINLEQDTLFVPLKQGETHGIAAALKAKQPERVLVFGLPPLALQLNLQVPKYQPFDFYNCSWLWADTLAQIEQDKALKTRLWQALQQLFLT